MSAFGFRSSLAGSCDPMCGSLEGVVFENRALKCRESTVSSHLANGGWLKLVLPEEVFRTVGGTIKLAPSNWHYSTGVAVGLKI